MSLAGVHGTRAYLLRLSEICSAGVGFQMVQTNQQRSMKIRPEPLSGKGDTVLLVKVAGYSVSLPSISKGSRNVKGCLAYNEALDSLVLPCRERGGWEGRLGQASPSVRIPC